jgi:hypothetical protein
MDYDLGSVRSYALQARLARPGQSTAEPLPMQPMAGIRAFR